MTVYRAPQGWNPLDFAVERVTGVTGTTLTLANAPIADLEQVIKNGVILEGGGTDYTLRGRTVTLGVASVAGDRWQVRYWIRPNRGE